MSLLLLEGGAYAASDILANRVQPQTEAGAQAVHYSRDWLAGQPVFSFQTSGSTGAPRAIEFTRAQVQASIRITREAFALKPGMNALLCLDLATVAGRMMLYRAWETGMSLWVVPPTANPLGGLPHNIRIDFAAFVPYQLQAMLQAPDSQKLQAVRTAIIGGAPVPDTLTPNLATLETRLFATYGMTETLTHVAVRVLNGPDCSDWFTPLPGIKVQLDPRGCLTVEAGHLPSPIITNDLALLRSDHSFQWLGRYDNVINSGGRKISPEAVEQKIAQIFARHGIANRFFVAGAPHPLLHQQVTLVVEGTHTQLWLNRLWPDLCATLLTFERPRALWQVEQFINTASGKINRPQSMQSSPQPLPVPEGV
jgi:O-succinylbenzoic acid--CoA ligase